MCSRQRYNGSSILHTRRCRGEEGKTCRVRGTTCCQTSGWERSSHSIVGVDRKSKARQSQASRTANHCSSLRRSASLGSCLEWGFAEMHLNSIDRSPDSRSAVVHIPFHITLHRTRTNAAQADMRAAHGQIYYPRTTRAVPVAYMDLPVRSAHQMTLWLRRASTQTHVTWTRNEYEMRSHRIGQSANLTYMLEDLPVGLVARNAL